MVYNIIQHVCVYIYIYVAGTGSTDFLLCPFVKKKA